MKEIFDELRELGIWLEEMNRDLERAIHDENSTPEMKGVCLVCSCVIVSFLGEAHKLLHKVHDALKENTRGQRSDPHPRNCTVLSAQLYGQQQVSTAVAMQLLTNCVLKLRDNYYQAIGNGEFSAPAVPGNAFDFSILSDFFGVRVHRR